jgi:hypothetical protein
MSLRVICSTMSLPVYENTNILLILLKLSIFNDNVDMFTNIYIWF